MPDRIGDCNAAGEIEHFHTDQAPRKQRGSCVLYVVHYRSDLGVQGDKAVDVAQHGTLFGKLGGLSKYNNNAHSRHTNPTYLH